MTKQHRLSFWKQTLFRDKPICSHPGYTCLTLVSWLKTRFMHMHKHMFMKNHVYRSNVVYADNLISYIRNDNFPMNSLFLSTLSILCQLHYSRVALSCCTCNIRHSLCICRKAFMYYTLRKTMLTRNVVGMYQWYTQVAKRWLTYYAKLIYRSILSWLNC